MKEMNAEMPAVGIMKLHEYPDAVWYDVACECGSKDHYHSIWIEAVFGEFRPFFIQINSELFNRNFERARELIREMEDSMFESSEPE